MESVKTLRPFHKWEYVTFSTHHGWEPPEYRCSKCERSYKGDDPAPKGPCLLAWKEDIDKVVIFLEGEEQELPLRYARRLARAILRIK